jgi:hypothetical protein
MITAPRPPLVGTLGTLATFGLPRIIQRAAEAIGDMSLADWNQAIGVAVGLLTAAYMLRQHARFHREKNDK